MLTNVEMSVGGFAAFSPSCDATAASRPETQLDVHVTPSWEKCQYVTRDAFESERIRGLQKRKLTTFYFGVWAGKLWRHPNGKSPSKRNKFIFSIANVQCVDFLLIQSNFWQLWPTNIYMSKPFWFSAYMSSIFWCFSDVFQRFTASHVSSEQHLPNI